MIDILTALIFVFFIMCGYRNGFMKSAYRAVAFFAALVLAYLLYPYVRDIILKSGFAAAVRAQILGNFESSGGEGIFSAPMLPGYLRSMAANGQIALADAVSGFLTGMTVNVAAFLIVFIAARLLIALFGKLLHIVSRLPVISFFDRGLGVIMGLMESLLLIYLVLAVIYAAAPLRNNPTVYKYISESTLTKTMYENNPIIGIVSPTDYENLIGE